MEGDELNYYNDKNLEFQDDILKSLKDVRNSIQNVGLFVIAVFLTLLGILFTNNHPVCVIHETVEIEASEADELQAKFNEEDSYYE